MGANIATIIILIAIIWQVVSAIIAHTQNQKQKQAGRVGGPSKRGSMTPSPGPGTSQEARTARTGIQLESGQASSSSTRLDELAARRQAQLEELRRRRQAEAASAGTPPATRRATTSIPTSRPSDPTLVLTSRASRRSPGEFQRQSDAAEAKQRDRGRQELTRQRQQAVDADRERSKEVAQTRADRVRARSLQQGREVDPFALDSGAEGPHLDQIRRYLSSPSSLRMLMVIKEVLDPPVAMRENR